MVEVEMTHEEGKKEKKSLFKRVGSYLEEKGAAYRERRAYERSPEGRAEKIRELKDRLEVEKLNTGLKLERNRAANVGFGGGFSQPRYSQPRYPMGAAPSMFGGPSLFGGPPLLRPAKPVKRTKRRKSKKSKGKGYVIVNGVAYPKG